MKMVEIDPIYVAIKLVASFAADWTAGYCCGSAVNEPTVMSVFTAAVAIASAVAVNWLTWGVMK